MRLSFLALAGALLATQVSAKDFQMPVDGDFWDGSLEWGEFGTGYEYKWMAFPSEGRVAVCGVGKFPDVANQGNSRAVMRKARLFIDEKLIMQDLSFFATVKKRDDLTKAKATCRLSDVAPPANAESVYIEYSGSYRF